MKEITQIQVFHFKIQMGRLKSKYDGQIRAMTQEKKEEIIFKKVILAKSLEILDNQTA